MKTKDEILKKYEDEYEYHFHEGDRKWIFKAMEKYAIELIREKLRWRDAEKELPDLLPDKNYSKNVFAKVHGFEEIQVMSLYIDEEGNKFWANCYDNINGSGILDDDLRMLINLSNHPLDEWDEKQKKEAAFLYGEVIDIPFPAVPPQADPFEIDRMTDEYLQKIQTVAKNNEVVVHIMGEFTFCFALIQKLQKQNIKCVASTTERNVRFLSTGERVVDFNFIQFRAYNLY